MIQITTQFVLPGEGMIIDGVLVTPDDQVLGDEQLDYLAGYDANRQRIREQRAS